ncbi:hypothetical protein Cfor_04341, partial [Coptotermes formosanus]
ESVADTSTSSPDMAGPVSPCPKVASESVRSSPSPAHRDSSRTLVFRADGSSDSRYMTHRASPDSAQPEMTPRREDPVPEEEGSEMRGGGPQVKKEGGDNSVFDGGGGCGGETRQGVVQRQGPSTVQQQQQPQQQQQQRANVVVTSAGMIPPPTFWVSPSSPVAAACRINGVRPELIGGGGVSFNPQSSSTSTSAITLLHHEMKPPATHAQSSRSSGGSPGVLRSAPTVIMGEAGGVRTMIWSQPTSMEPQQPPPSQQLLSAASTSTSTSCWSSSPSPASSGNGSEESAAQMLLNLGQEQQHHHLQGATAVASSSSRPPQFPPPLNMERLWAGDLTQLPVSQQQQMQALNLTSTATSGGSPMPWTHRNGGNGEQKLLPPSMPVLGAEHHPISHTQDDQEEEEQPMICMICEDKATGLHYGIITCEGCKGFFKRTVQNRRVYTCVADGNCEITKAQRNRCQYCRFKKCIEQGMVLQAVREDRMPGGRNSGAVYNLYKVKYKKHKKNPKNGQVKGQAEKQKGMVTPEHGIPPHLVNGTILKTALTNPSEVVHLRQRLDNAVSSSRDRTFPIEVTLTMIQTLIDCDEFQDIATLRNLDELLDHKSDLSDKLCQIGDSIVYKLVQWTKRLPFYLELPVEVHTRLLTHKWHELLVLTTSAYQAIHGAHKLGSTSSDGTEADFTQEVSNNLVTLQTCLTSMMGRPISIDQLRQDVGQMIEKITHVTLMFRRIKLRMEEYVCLKVIAMLNQGTCRGDSSELETIQERYMTCLRSFEEHHFPQQPTRFHELLVRLPE